jgi:hypothetical protein
VGALLPATEDLLVEVLEGLTAQDPALPELRAGKPGRNGSRYWLYGKTKKTFSGRRPFSQFDELRTAGMLRRLRTDKQTGTYYAFTPQAFAYRDRLIQQRSGEARTTADRRRPDNPPPEFSGAESRLEILRKLEAKARQDLDSLIDVSSLTKTVENDPNSGVVFIPLHPWRWLPLEAASRPVLGRAKRSLEVWLEAGNLTLATAGPEHLEQFNEASETLRRYIDRSEKASGPPSGDIDSARARAHELLHEQLQILDALPAAHEAGQTLVVPDTNALLTDPAIEDWQLGTEACTVVIVPQVQSELDEKKVGGNDQIKTRAASLIRRFREYGRRGDTFEGVPLAESRFLREIPVQAGNESAPNWLDVTHRDDRILVSALSLAAQHLTARLVVVTRDRNMQNKARMLQLPAVDVADL